MWRHVLLGSTKAFHCLLLQVFHQSWSSRRIDICGKSGSVGSWWSWFSLGTIAIINWILFLYTCSYAFRSSFHTVWGVASKHTNYKADSNNWDMRWRRNCHALHVSWQPAVFKSQRVFNSPLCFVRFCRVQVLPWRNWKHWDVDDAHLKRLDPWLHVKMLPQSYWLMPYTN